LGESFRLQCDAKGYLSVQEKSLNMDSWIRAHTEIAIDSALDITVE
tara:strand:+ start:1262 stop:1399 length:138 start_codon:yes stop_codon:yes gene_type:complete